MLIREAFPSDTAAIAQVHVDSWRTTYAGIVPADYLANLSYAQREQFWCDILCTPTPSPSNVHPVLDFLGHYFRSRDVVTIFVCRSLRWFLLGTARMLLVTSQVDVCRKLLQNVRELLGVHAAEDTPVRTGDGDHHPVIGLRYL